MTIFTVDPIESLYYALNHHIEHTNERLTKIEGDIKRLNDHMSKIGLFINKTEKRFSLIYLHLPMNDWDHVFSPLMSDSYEDE